MTILYIAMGVIASVPAVLLLQQLKLVKKVNLALSQYDELDKRIAVVEKKAESIVIEQ